MLQFPFGRFAAVVGVTMSLVVGACSSDPTAPAVDTAPTEVPDSEAPSSADPTSAAGGATGDTIPKNTIIAEERPPAPDWLAELEAEQVAASANWTAPHDFRFTDMQPESGITFENLVTPDGTIDFKPNQYDHGNGVAVADVDGDGLYDIYFVSQLGRNELWRNLGDGTFEEIVDAGVDFEDRVGVTASFGDFDNDGDPDLFATSVRFGNALFENDGTGHFTDITAQAGLEYSGHSSAAILFDFNRDGQLDIFLTNVGQYTTDEQVQAPSDAFDPEGKPLYTCYVGTTDAFSAHVDPARSELSILYQNNGDMTFTDVTEKVGLVSEAWSGDATVIDGNDDGWPDLYILDMQGHDQYFENVDGVGFVDKSLEMFPNTPWGSMGVKVIDHNNDGRLDLFVTDMHSDMNEDTVPDRDKMKARLQWPESLTRSEGRSIWGNAFYQKNEDGTYTEVSDAIGAENYWPWGTSSGDLNADGYEDLFIASSMNFFYRYAPNTVLLNDGGTRFVDSEFVLGVEPRRDGVAFQPWYTLDCGGEHWDHQNCVDGRYTGVIHTWQAKGSRASVIFDIDGDGDLDIVTNDWQSVPQVLMSDLADRGPVNHLSIRLVGNQSNRDGVGAIVTVVAGELTTTKANDGKSGYMAQSVLPLYFGLGDAAAADRVTVRWPTGEEQVLEGPLAGAITIEEGP